MNVFSSLRNLKPWKRKQKGDVKLPKESKRFMEFKGDSGHDFIKFFFVNYPDRIRVNKKAEPKFFNLDPNLVSIYFSRFDSYNLTRKHGEKSR